MWSMERLCLEAFARVKRGRLTVVAAAELVVLSQRQARRVTVRHPAEGSVIVLDKGTALIVKKLGVKPTPGKQK